MTTTADMRARLFAGLGLWLVLLLGWLLLRPGLGGEFIFDDAANLARLSGITTEPGWYTFVQYLTHGVSSSLGRPLSLVSFALQHESWPHDPAAFVRVNILLHLLNGAVLFWALLTWRRLADAPGEPPRWSAALALFITALWLLTPAQTNAVLYVVQRMAVLSGGCMLVGLLLHLKGRVAAVTGRPRAALLLMSAGVFVGLGVGTLAKENAALYPLLILVLEATLLRGVPRPAFWRPWSRAMLVFPLVLLAAYLGYRCLGLANEYGYRPFTLTERLLTEARVLFLYLKQLLVPSLYGIRILYDDLPLSKSLIEPWTTLPAVLAWPALAAAAWRLRERAPAFSFAVLWFLSAHLLESTFLPLELAFLHRNYVASLGPLLFLVDGFRGVVQHPAARRVRPVLAAGAAGYGLFVAISLYQTSALWGDPREQARYWALRQPDSRRAAMVYTEHLFRNGLTERAAAVLGAAVARWGDDAAMKATLLSAGCFHPELEVPSLAELRAALLRNDAHMSAVMGSLAGLVEAAEAGRCRRYDARELQAVLEAALEAPSLRPARTNTKVLLSRLLELRGERARAREVLDDAIRSSRRPDLITQGIYWALQAGDGVTAREYLALTASLRPLTRWAYRREFADLRQLVDRHAPPVPLP